MECDSFWGLAGPVCFAILWIPGPVGPTGGVSQERLLVGDFSQLRKKPECFLLLYSLLNGLHWKLRIYCCLQCW